MSFTGITEQEIRTLASSKKAYELGVAYALNGRVSQLSYDGEKNMISAVVIGTWLYDVEIIMRKNGSVYSCNCTCPAFEEYPGACKHVIAALKAVQRKLAAPLPRTAVVKESVSEFMALFTKSEPKAVRENLSLELELQIEIHRQIHAQLQIKVGLARLYVVKNLEEFLSAVQGGRLLKFGKQFTYDPFVQTFSAEDQLVIDMLQEMLRQYEAFNEQRSFYYASPFSQKPFILSQYYLGKLFDALGDKEFSLAHTSSKAGSKAGAAGLPRSIRVIRQDIPLDFAVESKEQDLTLALKSQLPLQLTNDGRYYFYAQDIYQVSPEQQSFLPNLLKTMSGKSRQTLTFPANQRDFFASEAIPLIEQLGTVSIEPKLAEKFVREELQTRIYFDRMGEYGIRARLEFHYGEYLINPFTSQGGANPQDPANSQILIRNIEKERKIIEIFEQAEFIVSQGTISLEDDEKIFDFITTWLPQLQEYAETFYSDDFKLTVRTSTSFSGRVRLDESLDLLEISFQYSDIDQDELANIFHSLQVKRKYYRLRDGSFLDLKQPELESMAIFLEHLNLKGEDLSNQTLRLPKFRAMYIDSFLRQANLPGIQRNKAFKQLVQSILEPQDGEYDPPSSLKHVLRDYQKTGFRWLKTLAAYGLGGILADDMGLGKTLQALAFILSEELASPALVIAPTSLIYNWQAEGEKFAPDLNILVVDGTPQERQEQLKALSQADLVVTSYALLRRDIETFAQVDFSYCFLDEAQNIKNPQTLNAKSVQRIKAKSYFALTGTPIENSLSELWSLFNFCMPGYLLSFQEFQKKYSAPILKGENPQALLELSRHIKPFILRRLKKEVLKELPPKIETEIKATLTEEQRKIYLAYLQQTKSQIAQDLATHGFAKSQIQILAALTRLRQICSHPGMFIDNYTGESGKMLLFQELLGDILDSGHRVLVFSQFTSMLDIIRDYLLSENIDYFYLSGSTKASERSQMAASFNKGQGRVFLISLKAGGTGLNLIGADTVIHFDPWWNPAVEDQATDRAHRIGQKNSVQVIKLLTQGTIEEKVNALQAKKKKLIDSVIQPGETMLTKLTEQELKELFELT
ncbi:DEAD/DEAH box helicase [Desulfitobacterium sp. PCE1]|uniref:DEAD/DEAH box helicase n=1 Tax=Desulfitobacterium sp. PCE1 TaxID=146907 RepID=UPI00037391C6|nr:DEAD/DEAH box helicase [Desulfitobacterium sp. PCE1]